MDARILGNYAFCRSEVQRFLSLYFQSSTRPTRRWRLLLFVAMAATRIGTAQAEPPVHYYDDAIGKTGAQLKAALKTIIDNHNVLPYTGAGTDTWAALKNLDQDPANILNVILVYSGISVPKSEQYNGTTGTWDREHLWPQSYGITALNSNSRAKTDLFNLRPINVGANSSRGNKYYDYSTPPISSYPGAPGSTYDTNSWEPRDPDKGSISRSMFYMAVRYDGTDADVPDLELSDTPDDDLYRFGKLSSLLEWHREFPVESSEKTRNQEIYDDYQNNRNPFVDHPDYAEMVFLGVGPGTAWLHTNFSDVELGDPLIGGDSGDPEHDGLGNLLEYTFNRNPWLPDQNAVVTVAPGRQGTTNYLYLTFSHNRNATDVTVSFETSTNLQTWTAASPQLISTTAISSEVETITVRFSTTASRLFARIRATRNP